MKRGFEASYNKLYHLPTLMHAFPTVAVDKLLGTDYIGIRRL
jgi:hypothetical protein